MTDEARACVARARAHLLCAACSIDSSTRQLQQSMPASSFKPLGPEQVQLPGPEAILSPVTMYRCTVRSNGVRNVAGAVGRCRFE